MQKQSAKRLTKNAQALPQWQNDNKILSINLWRLPNVSVEIGNKRKITNGISDFGT